MDEKGFAIGQIRRMKRVFSKAAFIAGTAETFTHDSKREWTTISGTICVDGLAVPPAMIYAAKNGNIRNRSMLHAGPIFVVASPKTYRHVYLFRYHG